MIKPKSLGLLAQRDADKMLEVLWMQDEESIGIQAN